MKISALLGIVSLLLVLAIAGCEKSTSPVTQGSLALSEKYSTATPPLMKTGGVAGVDSIVITRARFVLRDITFKSEPDSIEFKSTPFVLELNLGSGINQMAVRDVPLASYDRIEFDVHRVESSEVALLPVEERAAFADFLAGERYSIIVEGTVYRSPEADAAFVVRSKIDAKQKIDLVPPLVLTETSADANATLLISSGGWFQDQLGNPLDPSDPANESQIGENLKNSIRVFKDNNRDGSKDPN